MESVIVCLLFNWVESYLVSGIISKAFIGRLKSVSLSCFLDNIKWACILGNWAS